jgi:cobyrinic acid a,c-diamide synthase
LRARTVGRVSLRAADAPGAPLERPAVLVAAPGSGHGKTTVAAALARAWHDRGLRVRALKTGPDFLDPMVLERACGAPALQLDAWMGGDPHCAALLHRAAADADVVLIEGAMGLFDGTPSCADLAASFGLPVLLAIDASATAQTFGAIAHGLATYRPGLRIAGVLANRCGGEAHVAMLRDAVPRSIRWWGALPYDAGYALPSRHLGLVQAAEIDDLERRIAAAAHALAEGSTTGTAAGPPLPPSVRFATPGPATAVARTLAGRTVAIARDAAFAFSYPANFETLRELGAELAFFSPLADEPVPEGAYALWLPGGYPELHLEALARNARARDSVRAHHAADRPILAECGGMLWLLDGLADAAGRRAPMLGLLPGEARVGRRLANLGLQSLDTPRGELRGQTFHHAVASVRLEPAGFTRARPGHGRPEPVWRRGRLTASFLHGYFPSNPAAAAALLGG